MSTDNEVIERSADEPGAFALLFDRHAPAIYRYAAQRLGEGSAEDVMSETFLVAFEKRAAYDSRSSMLAPGCSGSPPA
ncbi:RNA polymerase sigma factor [Microbacterium sp. NPDC003461]